jgi:hypothetical protein
MVLYYVLALDVRDQSDVIFLVERVQAISVRNGVKMPISMLGSAGVVSDTTTSAK